MLLTLDTIKSPLGTDQTIIGNRIRSKGHSLCCVMDELSAQFLVCTFLGVKDNELSSLQTCPASS